MLLQKMWTPPGRGETKAGQSKNSQIIQETLGGEKGGEKKKGKKGGIRITASDLDLTKKKKKNGKRF